MNDAPTHPVSLMPSADAFLHGGGEMGERMRAFDWHPTSLGPPDRWPIALRVVVRVMLTSNHPMFVFWGPDHVCFYNDAYSRSLGSEKHPSMLGAKGQMAWHEIWDVIGPQIELVMAGQGSTWHENQLIPITRHGRLEPVYWTYSYSPIDDEASPHGVGGVMVICSETTHQVEERRILKEAEERWRQLFEQAPGFICMLRGPKHRYEFVNPAYQRLIGRDPDRIVGSTVMDVMPELGGQGFVALLDEVRRSGKMHIGHAVPLRLGSTDRAEDRLLYVDFVYQPILNAWGGPEGIFVQGMDVTNQVLDHKAVAESEARYRALVNHLPGGAVFVVDNQLRCVMAGGEALAASGFRADSLVGNKLAEGQSPWLASDLITFYRRCLAGERFELEHRVHGRDYVTRGAPLRDEVGVISGALVASYEIAARIGPGASEHP